MGSLQISPYQVDQVFCQFWRDLLLGSNGEMKADVILQYLAIKLLILSLAKIRSGSGMTI
jgi:hypothetical protein